MRIAQITSFIALALLAGCATQVKVTNVRFTTDGLIRPWWGDPSHRRILQKHDLQTLIRDNPESALLKLETMVARDPQITEIAGLAELNCRYARKLGQSDPQKALGFYLCAAAVTYPHIQKEPGVDGQWDKRLLQSYNTATAGAVMMMQALPGGVKARHRADCGERRFQISALAGDYASEPHSYDQWFDADHWKQRGLGKHHRHDGLGARLVAKRKNRQNAPYEIHQPDEGIFHPSTAILRFQAVRFGRIQVRLAFHNPAITSELKLGGRTWKLAADLTLPGAMLLSQTRPLLKSRWTALIRPGETPRPHRLYLMQPYAPDRIPIIMVHGLYSTPLAWQQLTNELWGDPEIRSRYQIWHYLYPTGLPFLTTAADFRDELEEVRRILDPEGRDFATNHMIVIGHSMGGLLTRTLITDSGDSMWNSTFTKPVSKLDSGLKEVLELRRMFYFKPKPYVKRVIFIAVPHRGSKIADSFIARLVAGSVHLTDNHHRFIEKLKTTFPDLLKPTAAGLFERGYPNSIRTLSPKTVGLMALAELPVSPEIPFHSIIGNLGLRLGAWSSDGVVPYWSSHLPQAASEIIVPAGHGAYSHSATIKEVTRILKLHPK